MLQELQDSVIITTSTFATDNTRVLGILYIKTYMFDEPVPD